MNEENNVLTIKTVQIQPIRNMITAIKDILTDATITFTKDGMKIINFDKIFLQSLNYIIKHVLYDCNVNVPSTSKIDCVVVQNKVFV